MLEGQCVASIRRPSRGDERLAKVRNRKHNCPWKDRPLGAAVAYHRLKIESVNGQWLPANHEWISQVSKPPKRRQRRQLDRQVSIHKVQITGRSALLVGSRKVPVVPIAKAAHQLGDEVGVRHRPLDQERFVAYQHIGCSHLGPEPDLVD